MDAVLRPGLRDALQFDVGRIAAEAGEVPLDGVHLVQIQAEHPVFADLHQALVADAEDRHLASLEAVLRRLGRVRDFHVAEEDLLDGRVMKDAIADDVQLFTGGLAVEEELASGANAVGMEAEVGDSLARAGLDGVHHARLAEDLDDGVAAALRRLHRRVDGEVLVHRIGE